MTRACECKYIIKQLPIGTIFQLKDGGKFVDAVLLNNKAPNDFFLALCIGKTNLHCGGMERGSRIFGYTVEDNCWWFSYDIEIKIPTKHLKNY